MLRLETIASSLSTRNSVKVSQAWSNGWPACVVAGGAHRRLELERAAAGPADRASALAREVAQRAQAAVRRLAELAHQVRALHLVLPRVGGVATPPAIAGLDGDESRLRCHALRVGAAAAAINDPGASPPSWKPRHCSTRTHLSGVRGAGGRQRRQQRNGSATSRAPSRNENGTVGQVVPLTQSDSSEPDPTCSDAGPAKLPS